VLAEMTPGLMTVLLFFALALAIIEAVFGRRER
jgi:hypothetical protein